MTWRGHIGMQGHRWLRFSEVLCLLRTCELDPRKSGAFASLCRLVKVIQSDSKWMIFTSKAKAIATRRRLVLRCSIPHANGQDVVLAACERRPGVLHESSTECHVHRCEGILSCRHSSRHWLQPQDEQPLVQLLASHACLSTLAKP